MNREARLTGLSSTVASERVPGQTHPALGDTFQCRAGAEEMFQIDPEQIESASLSDAGLIRTSNQDACGEFSDPAGFRLFVVADGMGGHRGGETASRLAVETIGAGLRNSDQSPEGMLRSAFRAANDRIFRLAGANIDLAHMGTTGVGLLLSSDGSAWVAHVGDSRAYRLRAGRLEALTADHSAVAELLRRGIVTAEEAATHPRRNELLRSIGVRDSVEVDVRALTVEPGDRFLLCSDGLWGLVSEAEIEAVIGREEPDSSVRMLVELANAHGGNDNITAQVVRIPGTPREAPQTAEVEQLQTGTVGEERPWLPHWVPALVIAALGALLAAVIWLF
jgi:protein phosphatase